MARNRALASARRAYNKGKKVREAQERRSQKPKKKRNKSVRERSTPKVEKPRNQGSSTRTTKPAAFKPKTDVSSQYKSYKNSSFAPKVTKPKVSNTSLSSAQKALDKRNKANESAQKKGIVTSNVTKPKSNVISDFSKPKKYDYKKDLIKAYKEGSTKTYLGTDQKETTTTLKSKKKQKEEYDQKKIKKKEYYKSKDWKTTKSDLKRQNQEGWRKALSDQGWSRKDIDDWMNSDEGKKYRRETYFETKNAVKDSINKEIDASNEKLKKQIRSTSKLKSVDALTRGEFDKMVTASRLGKKLGNKYLESVGGKELGEKIGSKTVEAGIRSKAAYGVMQGMSKGDIWSGSVGSYNKSAKAGMKKVKGSKSYLIGYGTGMAADMLMGGVASRGASVAEGVGKGVSKVAGKLGAKGVSKEVPKKALEDAAEEFAKVSGKEGAKRFAKNRAGEFVAEAPTNVLDAAKMSLDADGNLDRKEFKKWLAINGALTFGVGGAMEGIGAGATRRLATKTEELLAKREAGNITEEELKQLDKNIEKLSRKSKADIKTMSSDIAEARMGSINAKSAAEAKAVAEAEAKEVPKKFYGRGNRYTQSAQGQGTRARADYAEKLAENEQRMTDRKIANRQPILDEKGIAMRRSGNRAASIAEAKALQNEAKNYPDRATIRKQIDEATENLNALRAKAENPNIPKKDRLEQIKKLEDRVTELRRQEGVVWRAEKASANPAVRSAEEATKKIEQVNKALADAKKAFAENPTPETRARMDLAEEAVENVKATTKSKRTSIFDKVRNLKTIDEVRARAKELGGKDIREVTREEEKELQLLNQALVDYKNKSGFWYPHFSGAEPKAPAVPLEQGKLADDEFARMTELNEKQATTKLSNEEMTELNTLKLKSRGELSDRGFAMLNEDIPFKEGSGAGSDVVKQSQKEADDFFEGEGKAKGGKEKPPKGAEKGAVNAKTPVHKKPLSLRFREMVSDNFAAIEDIANRLPDGARKDLLTAINEVRRASKTGRAVVAEKGRKIYTDLGLNKRGKATAAKRNDHEWYCFLMHELDRKKAGNNFTDLSREEIYNQMKELETRYATNVLRDGNGNMITDDFGRAALLDSNGKRTGEFADFENWEVVTKDGEYIDKNLDDVLQTSVKDFQKNMRDYFRELLDRELDARVISKADYDEIVKKYPNYVPTYREKQFSDMLKTSTWDEINVGRGLKSAVGGSQDPLVPLYNQMQVKTNSVLKRSELNKMLNILCEVSGTSQKELDDMIPWFKRMDESEKADKLMDAQVFTKSEKGKNVAVMYRDGVPIKIDIDQDVYREIRRWSGEDRKNMTLARLVAGKIIDNSGIRFLNQNFKKLITDYNLIFGVKNLKRDMATALFYTTDVKGFVKNMPKGFACALLPDKMLSKNMKIYKEAYQVYKENGGVISQFIARDSASDNFFDPLVKGNPFKWVESFNSAMETIPRMTEFISALDSKALEVAGKEGNYEDAFKGLLKNKDEVAKAMYRAKDVTLNFDRSGWLGAKLNRGLIPFFNPAAQGMSKLYRVTVRDNIKYGKNFKVDAKGTMESFMKMGVYLTGMVGLPAMAWNMAFADEINGKAKGYEKQSDYNRYSNYLLPIGDGKFFKIPKARELASLQAMSDWAYDNLKYGSGNTWEKLFMDGKERDVFSMLTIAREQTGPLTPWSDSLFMPIYNTIHNKTWYGGKIESGTDDEMHREAGEYSKIWDEKTSGAAKAIGQKFNMSPKKVDNILDSYLGVFYDMGISQFSAKNDAKAVWKEEGAFNGIAQFTKTPWGNAFIIDSVFQNANKSDYYDLTDSRDKQLKKMKEGSDEWLELKAEQSRDKNAFSYTSSSYDELQAQIWLDKKLTMAQKKKYARALKAGDNLLWNERKDGKTNPSKDPMAVVWDMKTKDGKHILSTDKIIESCSYTFKSGDNTINDAWKYYKKNGGKSANKFMEVTLNARDMKRRAGDSLTTPRWEEIAYTNQLNHTKGSGKVLASYIQDETKRENYMGNAKVYEEYGGSKKTYLTMKRTVTQEAYKLGYDYPSQMRDGELTMSLATARTKGGKQYRDLAYQANGTWILDNRMNAGRCLDTRLKSKYTQKTLKKFCDKYELDPSEGHKWTDKDIDKVCKAIDKEYPDDDNELKAAKFVVITGLTWKNPYGDIGDYSIASDTGVYCVDAYKGHGRGHGRRGGHGWGHGGGRGGRGGTYDPAVYKAKKLKVKDYTFKSNLDDAYRKNLKKLREEQRRMK